MLGDMKSLLDFPSVGPKKPLYKILKHIWLGSLGGYYGMSEARVVASFKKILTLGLGRNLESVLKFLTKTEKR